MNKQLTKHIFSLFLFGSNGIVASYISLSSYEIVFFRTMLGGAFLALFFFLSKQTFTFTKHKKDFLFIVLSGISMGASWMFLYEAYDTIGISLACITYYCGPVIVMALSPFLFKERLNIQKLSGFIAVLFGIFLINGKLSGTSLSLWGFFCASMSAVTYSLMVIFNKKSESIKGIENSLIQLIISFLTVSAFIGIKTGFAIQLKPQDYIWLFVLGIVNTGFGCYLYFSSIGHLPVQTVAICGYLEALSAIVFAFLILKERMTSYQIIGGILILGGAVYAECFGANKRRLSKK